METDSNESANKQIWNKMSKFLIIIYFDNMNNFPKFQFFCIKIMDKLSCTLKVFISNGQTGGLH